MSEYGGQRWCLVTALDHRWALPVSHLRAVATIRSLTPIPHANPSVIGATNHHGTPLLVVKPYPLLENHAIPKDWRPALAVVLDREALNCDAHGDLEYGFGADVVSDTVDAEATAVGDAWIVMISGKPVKAWPHRILSERLQALVSEQQQKSENSQKNTLPSLSS